LLWTHALERVKQLKNRWTGAARPLRQPLRGFLKMRNSLNPIIGLAHESGTNLTNDSRSLSIRHPRESGGPGQVLALAALDTRFRGHDEEVEFVGSKRQKCTDRASIIRPARRVRY
jgi:hypothetical protein